MNLTQLALKRPVTTSLFFISMLLFGLTATKLLPLELLPGIDIPQVIIDVPYKGSSPSEVEREITRVLEESLATLSGVEELNSTSNQDGAEIELIMKWGENIATKSLEAREKIDAVRHLLPQDVERIFIRQFSTSDLPLLTVRISSQHALSDAYDLLEKQLKKPLERIEGVSKVTLYGVDKKQIRIQVDAKKLAASGISMEALTNRLQNENFVINAGTLRTKTLVYQLSPQGEFQRLEDIIQLSITQYVTLGDLASVNYQLPEPIEGRHLGRQFAVGLDIFKASGANLVAVSEKVLAVIEKTKKNTEFDGIKLYIMEDQADGVKSSLTDLLTAGLIGALLSFIMLYFFLRDLKITLIVVSSVPIAIAITLAIMYLLGYSLNILSMMGLLLAIGMLIDNAVVITESVLQEKQQEKRDKKSQTLALIKGVDKVSLAVLAGTLTTAIVFLPNIFGVKVELTIFLEHVAIAICIALASSLLIAKTLIPLLLNHIHFKPKTNHKPSRLAQAYRTHLSRLLAHPKTGWLIAIILLASTAIPLHFVKQDQDDNQGTERLYLDYNVEGRHNLDVTKNMINRMEAYLYEHKETFHIDTVYSYYSPSSGQSTLLLKPDLPITVGELKDNIRQGFPTFAIATPQFGWGNQNQGLRISLTGRSTAKLIQLSEHIVPLLSRIEGMTDLRSELNSAQQEVIIKIDRQLVARLNLSLQDVASNIATALRGNALRSFRHDPSGELRINMTFTPMQLSLNQLKQLPILRIDERVYSLENLSHISIEPRFDSIRHYNRQTALTIGANLDDLSLQEAQTQITQIMEHVVLPPGYQYSLTGGFERQDEEQNIMATNMLLAIAMIYIVMAALFESLLLPTAIISSIIFSITGVFWGLLLTNTSLSMMPMIGILILMGIVVNNGIVLVDQINQQQPSLANLSSAIAQVCVTRLRPVLMTVSTTVLGLLPLAMGDTQIGGGGPAYAPMAIAIIGGLLFSTVTSLFLVPLCYQALYRLRHHAVIQFSAAHHLSQKALPRFMRK
ncbi:efflux RND transporter permease subunit [Shewanella surugensis]|uniref:Efflux RND transporter permease subunit n=1 Tax=Shewanella surugensis TaxID=212020 RepID=A0ABT0LFL2_9GAMM|nr:efflux RND transporter permease subunit [Shewanella surugensis]MCL1126488.1 efflux RND transporter permease subunit [Shewanella surugensis]